MPTKVRVMTFNLRIPAKIDGINQFENREGRILSCIRQYSPDIIGFQEVNDLSRPFLKEALTEYDTVGIGRTVNYTGEGCTIAFKKDLFELVSLDHFMLSSTPEVWGSRYEGSDQSKCPRVYVRVLLKHHDIEEPFYFYDVHTDHEGSLSRCLASMQLVQDIASHDKKFIITGDFNAQPDDKEIKMITASAVRPVADITKDLGGTFHNFGRLETPVKIDYIFIDPAIGVTLCERVKDEPVDGLYVSDHNPVIANLEF